MPNHVTNEVIFSNVGDSAEEAIRAACGGEDGVIDFAGLLPPPLNSWRGGVGVQHKVFPHNDLDWCTQNWSTKWGAYGTPSITREGSDIVLRFRTAWRHPYGWLLALFNHLGVGFTSHYLSEGEGAAKTCEWRWVKQAFTSCEWSEKEAEQEIHLRLYLKLWGKTEEEMR